MSAASAPGLGSTFRPIPPDRGSFPLDHYGKCSEYVNKYLECVKITKGQNAPNCRHLAQNYLQCRMDKDLMDTDDMDNLGFANLPRAAPTASTASTAARAPTAATATPRSD